MRTLGVVAFLSTSCLVAIACDDGDDGGGAGGSGATGGVGAAGGTSGEGGGTGGAGGGAGGAGGGAGGATACVDDEYEDNDVAMTATQVPMELPVEGDPDWYGEDLWYVWNEISAYKCSGDDDWYFIKTSFDTPADDPPETRYWSLVLRVAGAGSCGASCEDYVPPAGPEHTVTVDVFNATTMAPLTTRTSDEGLIRLWGYGADFANDVLIRVSGPPEAVYPYDFTTTARSDAFEDECEC
ncbi:hypothetical protein [Chondromyces crocatus]|nr:hypothetical protein [Chondromyces crocatus]